ncbi:MAG: lipopolysaccharide heptosyltransferase II [Verrucomicrobiota bacterium]|nr:lipopolysaccharide heptosyltransferase II [Verrucomicrobiota bacterium]
MGLLKYILFCLGYFYAQMLPMKALPWVGALSGALWFWLDGTRRKVTLKNLKEALGKDWSPQDLKRKARNVFQNTAFHYLVYLKLGAKSQHHIRKHFVLEGQDHFGLSLSRKKGTILVGSRQSNWHLAGHALSELKGARISVLYERSKNHLLESSLDELRGRYGFHFLHGPGSWKEAIKRLRDNEVVLIFADGPVDRHGLWTVFFGHLASTSFLPALLALKTGSALLPLSCMRTGMLQWKVEIHEQLPLKHLGISYAMTELTYHLNMALEKLIRKNPLEWHWHQDKWKPQVDSLLFKSKRHVYIEKVEQLKKFKFLVREVNWLGDAVMTLPAIHNLKLGRPDSYVAVLTPTKLADFWRACPDVDEIIEIRTGHTMKSLADSISEKNFDAFIAFPNSARSALPGFFAEIPLRIGYKGHWRKWFLTNVVPETARHDNEEHQQEDYLGIIRHIGGSGTFQIPDLHFDVSLEEFQLPSSKPIIIVCPSAEYGPAKKWLPERYAEACKRIALDQEATLVYVGMAKDSAAIEDIIQKSGVYGYNLAGKTSLSQLGALLTNAKVVLCNDSGTMHLASVVGTRVVAIYGSTEPQLTGPLGPHKTILRHHVECSPCFLRECPLDFRCMKSVTVMEVVDAVNAQLKR